MTFRFAALLLSLLSLAAPRQAETFKFPLKSGSVRFAVIGDMGTGKAAQYEISRRMAEARQSFPFDFVITLGDNIYGGHKAEDFEKKFALPYKALLEDRKSTRLNSSHPSISYAVFC